MCDQPVGKADRRVHQAEDDPHDNKGSEDVPARIPAPADLFVDQTGKPAPGEDDNQRSEQEVDVKRPEGRWKEAVGVEGQKVVEAVRNAFGVKAAVFPLFFWLPAAYHTPAFSVSAVFAGLLTKVGVYALIRMFTLVFDHDTGFTHTILLWVACLTMVTGVLGAAAQGDMRRILSFHIVSQIGYMVLGLALLTPLAIVGAVFYLVHHIIVKANLFLIAGVADRLTGGTALSRIGGLYASAPLLAALFLVPAFSLAGFPPLSGFWAKFLLVKAALEIEGWVIAAIALAVGLLTIYSMTKIWAQAFWEPHPEGREPRLSNLPAGQRWAMLAPIMALAALTVFIGLFPEPFVAFAERAAAQLLDPADYVQTVLGDRG